MPFHPNKFSNMIIITMAVIGLSLRVGASEEAVDMLIAQAKTDSAADASATALPALEVVFEVQGGLTDSLCLEYWRLVDKAKDYPRALHFFEALAESHPRDAEILANHGRAVACSIGWMFDRGLGLHAMPRIATAERAFGMALALDPENFTALLSRAIFHAHMPGGKEAAQMEFDQLDKLRDRHPGFDWQAFDSEKRAALGGEF